MFFRKKEQRSIDEILTPKAEDYEEVETNKECEEVEEEQESKKEQAKKNDGTFDKIVKELDFDPSVYYGWGDGKMDCKMKKVTELWKVVASIVWFLFGSLTFAPVLFTAGKINQFINNKKRAFWASMIIYSLSTVALVYLLFFIK
jgi:hypothetical protein